MENNNQITETVTEVVEEISSVAEPTKIIKPRTDAQKIALEKARVRAGIVRHENATRKKDEAAAVKQNQLDKENEAQNQDAQQDSDSEEDLPSRPTTKKKKKRRVIVTEMSSDESDVEIVLPKMKRSQSSPQKREYERAVKKMFEYE